MLPASEFGGWIFIIFLLTICSTFPPPASLSPCFTGICVGNPDSFCNPSGISTKGIFRTFFHSFLGNVLEFSVGRNGQKKIFACPLHFRKKDWQSAVPLCQSPISSNYPRETPGFFLLLERPDSSITAPPSPHSPGPRRSAWPGWSWRSSPPPSTPDAPRRW